MNKFFLLCLAALFLSGCLVEFGPADSSGYVVDYVDYCDEESVEYLYTEVDCPDEIWTFVLCDPWGEIYRPACLDEPPRVLFLSHCFVTHYCDSGVW
tara:strand:+ start:730 stop:1020 length:291 start_codon:yes stop_codon:yes gene_type:complete